MTADRLTEIEKDLNERLFKHGGYTEVRELIEFAWEVLVNKGVTKNSAGVNSSTCCIETSCDNPHRSDFSAY